MTITIVPKHWRQDRSEKDKILFYFTTAETYLDQEAADTYRVDMQYLESNGRRYRLAVDPADRRFPVSLAPLAEAIERERLRMVAQKNGEPEPPDERL